MVLIRAVCPQNPPLPIHLCTRPSDALISLLPHHRFPTHASLRLDRRVQLFVAYEWFLKKLDPGAGAGDRNGAQTLFSFILPLDGEVPPKGVEGVLLQART